MDFNTFLPSDQLGTFLYDMQNNDAKLLSFYNDNKFVKFDTRQTTSKDQEPLFL